MICVGLIVQLTQFLTLTIVRVMPIRRLPGCYLPDWMLDGSLVILSYTENWGSKSSTFWGSSIMIIANFMQAASFEYGLFVGGCIVSVVGNGMVTASMYGHFFLPHSMLEMHLNSHPSLAKRVCSSPSTRCSHHTIWSVDLMLCDDCLLGRL
jgi:hypothetical protein